MWHVIQVLAGRERGTLAKIERQADPSTYKRCVIPIREQPYRRDGVWETREEILFPGYLLVNTRTPARFRRELFHVAEATKMLCGKDGDGECLFAPLTRDEVKLITGLMGEFDCTVGMSTGVIEGDEVIVTCGPLRGREGLICKVDRHKRSAWLKVQMFGRTLTVKLGLEIVSKN